MSAPVLAGPRWPHHKAISPSALKSYRDCPHRVRLQYIDNVPREEKFILFFAKGNAVHWALQKIASALRDNRTPLSDAAVMEMARHRLPSREFPSEDAWLVEVHDVVRCVQRGRQYIESFQHPRWILIEQLLGRDWILHRNLPPYRVLARPDLIVQRDEPTGERVVDIIDYKTGTRWVDEMPAVMLRFVARGLLERFGIDPDSVPIRFTYLWLDTGQRDVFDLNADFIGHHWEATFREMKKLTSESEWIATPSFRCKYCPYHQNVCTEQIPYEDAFGPT